jgi:DNA-binding beta-propeller fold protein YncE
MRRSFAVIACVGMFAASAFATNAGTVFVYISDSQNNRIRAINGTTGVITTFAGNGTGWYGGDGGPATGAMLHNPTGVAVNPATGDVYISDNANNRIRKVTRTSGVITTVAGTGAAGYAGDGAAATGAQLNGPYGVAVDSFGNNLYIADTNNNVIRKVNFASGNISTVAGNGTVGNFGDGGLATSAQLYHPTGIALDGTDASNDLYIADSGNQEIRRVASATGVITTVIGTGNVGYTGCSVGPFGIPAAAVGLHTPTGISIDITRDFFIADYGNQCVRVIDAGTDAFALGNGVASYGGDGGPAANAELNYPTGVAADAVAGVVYIADYGNHRVRAVAYASPLIISTFAGTGTPGFSGDGGLATGAQLYNPTGVAFYRAAVAP